MALLDRIAAGRTDLIFEFLAEGHAASSTDHDGVSLLQCCAYFGDVSAMKYLLTQGARLESLEENLGLNAACFHGHWRLCEFLLEQGAAVNEPYAETGETPLHSALCTPNRLRHNVVIKVLLGHGANPNVATKPGVETGGFMRDCRTKGETPLHRAAAFGDEEAIQMLLDSGALINAQDSNGDSPLSWGSWYCRPIPLLQKLCYPPFRIRPDYGKGMEANLIGSPLES